MAYKECEDCGTRMYGGVCSNCQEELYIVQNQGEHIENPSPEFWEKVTQQEQLLEERSQR